MSNGVTECWMGIDSPSQLPDCTNVFVDTSDGASMEYPHIADVGQVYNVIGISCHLK